MKEEVIFHTDELLRRHRLLVRQTGFGKKAVYDLVDWQTHRRVSRKREDAFLADEKR